MQAGALRVVPFPGRGGGEGRLGRPSEVAGGSAGGGGVETFLDTLYISSPQRLFWRGKMRQNRHRLAAKFRFKPWVPDFYAGPLEERGGAPQGPAARVMVGYGRGWAAGNRTPLGIRSLLVSLVYFSLRVVNKKNCLAFKKKSG